MVLVFNLILLEMKKRNDNKFEKLEDFKIKSDLMENKVRGGEDPPGSYGQLATYVDGVFWGYDGERYSIDIDDNYYWY